jgi:hypothetical protein
LGDNSYPLILPAWWHRQNDRKILLTIAEKKGYDAGDKNEHTLLKG